MTKMIFGKNETRLRNLFINNLNSQFLDPDWTKLPPIWAGGASDHPKIAMVFINPTYRNQSASFDWPYDRAPFIGLKRPWKFLSTCGLVSEEVVDSLPADQTWTIADASRIYETVALSGLYVTNLVKACRATSDLPPISLARQFLDLLATELDIVKPDFIVSMGGLVSSLLLKQQFSLGQAFDHLEAAGTPLVAGTFAGARLVPSYFPVGRGSSPKARAIIGRLWSQLSNE